MLPLTDYSCGGSAGARGGSSGPDTVDETMWLHDRDGDELGGAPRAEPAGGGRGLTDPHDSASVDLPGGELRLLQPRESAELPDAGAVEWAPIAPYWSVLWRSGMALARELDGMDLAGLRVAELGCGLAVPSIATARAGADVLATDISGEALELVERNARANGVRIETATVDWAEPGDLIGLGPFDMVLAADVLYEGGAVPLLLSLLPRLAPEVWLADPGRAAAVEFLEQAANRWWIETSVRGVVRIHRLRSRRPD